MRFSLAALVVVALASPAFAHKLELVSKQVGDQLRVEAFYADDTPAQEAKVTVSIEGNVVAEGRTDEKGVWTCPKPAPGTYSVRVESVGHAAKETLVIADAALAAEPESTAPAESSARFAKTATPWRRIALGLGLIAGVSILSYVLRKNAPRRN
ncbi:MAG TPA: carboxypeptidase-like regulatory domain-containing protein [Gemmataceae bacterium]|nr:carboxypeptidase-like regulatory domain-containing protein [Gemmataceae bacterium]